MLVLITAPCPEPATTCSHQGGTHLVDLQGCDHLLFLHAMRGALGLFLEKPNVMASKSPTLGPWFGGSFTSLSLNTELDATEDSGISQGSDKSNSLAKLPGLLCFPFHLAAPRPGELMHSVNDLTGIS